MINSYEDAHLWDNYRRNRSSFSLKQAFMRGYTRYNAKLKEVGKGFGLFTELFSATNLLDLYTTGAEADGLLKPNAIATSMIFDHFTRILTRPTTGAHFLDSAFDPRIGADPALKDQLSVFRSDDQQLQANAAPQAGGTTLWVPDGSQGIGIDLAFGGRPLFNELDRSKGYYATQYDAWVGSYYDKTLVADMLTECEDRRRSLSQHQLRYHLPGRRAAPGRRSDDRRCGVTRLARRKPVERASTRRRSHTSRRYGLPLLLAGSWSGDLLAPLWLGHL
jgi:hypothetical protein